MEQKREDLLLDLDSVIHGLQSKITLNISPVSQSLAFIDWLSSLADSPSKRFELFVEYLKGVSKFYEEFWSIISSFAGGVSREGKENEGKSSVNDPRFSAREWEIFPFNIFYRSFLLAEDWWMKATKGVPGVSKHHENVVSFMVKQMLDVFSPTNYIFTNPEVFKLTVEEWGANLVRGWVNFLEDWRRNAAGEKPVGTEKFVIGKNIACTPGKVVYRNRLIELIQYSPTTQEVYNEPILIVPAWIMKYYILDLSPQNSMVKFLVDKGHTVFMISWKNPTSEDRDISMEDYRKLGVMSAIDAISAIIPDRKLHAVGYCLGGTILAISAAAMARDGDERLKTMTLLAAQTDFTEAGEIMVFIDEAEVRYLEDIMASKGYLDTKEMVGAFQMLRSYDQFWSRIIHDYLMGKRSEMIDLMAWNADATRMPYKMHSEYLRKLFLNNDLFEGRYKVDGKSIVLSDIHVPVFMVGTEKDHVAPWKSVYKFNLTSDAETVTFVLTSGGHNAGIVSEPNHPRRTYRLATRKEGEKYVDPDSWVKQTPVSKGSWWIPWEKWLCEHSSGKTNPPPMGAPENGYVVLGDAPGTYVFEK